MITVVAMGAKYGDLTLDGLTAINNADTVVAKSNKTHVATTLNSLQVDFVSCDDLYQATDDFDQLNQQIVARLVSYSNNGDVAFCVYGDGHDDSTVEALVQANVPHQLVSGVAVLGSVNKGYCDDYKVLTAQAFVAQKYPANDNLLIKNIDDALLAGEVKLKLLQSFDYDTAVLFFNQDGTKTITVEEVDRQSYNYQTSLFVAKRPLTQRKVHYYTDLLHVLTVLRGRNGCEWDKAQTHQSIKRNAVEEAYELVNAIDNWDVDNVIEELGDVLMQVAFHLDMAMDEGEFDASDVYSYVCNKLISRHPHVFGDVVAKDVQTALSSWDSVKQTQHQTQTLTAKLDDVPASFPSLLKTQKCQSRASKHGYDFADVQQAKDKLLEEIDEFLSASDDNKEMEGGDLLFAAVNLLRLADVDCETALLKSCQKFVKRVKACEQILQQQGKTLKQLSQSQFDDLWERVKRNESY
ncbi:MAG: nucleoside triphosphate pyrophosphohydrolase [Clostridia bacterium]|nr:nucleoside triphosphate pyrophosphohydrolase [Clostridia bacterium]